MIHHSIPRLPAQRGAEKPLRLFEFGAFVRRLPWAVLFGVFTLGSASAALEITADTLSIPAVGEAESWAIRIEMKNTGSTPAGPLTLQYRVSGYTEFSEDGKPDGELEHTDLSLSHGTIPPGGKASVDTPRVGGTGPLEGAAARRVAKGMVQNIRVRAWQHGKLVGEFARKAAKQATDEWPLNPPPIPAGVEAGSGPWLLLDKGGADFAGLTMGASAVDVLKTLKSLGNGRIDAKPDPLHGHPFRMAHADLPGVVFGFDSNKKLSAVVVTDPARVKLPGNLLLGKSKPADFNAVFGTSATPAPLPSGASAASRFQIGKLSLTIAETAAGDLKPLLLLEAAP